MEEGNWLLAVASFEATSSVFNITNENNSFSISIPGCWTPKDGKGFINKLFKLLELRSENYIESHVKEVERRGSRIEIEKSGYNLAGVDQFGRAIQAKLKRVNYGDLEDMV